MLRLLLLVLILTFAALPTAAQAEQWLIVKDKDGKCSIWKTKQGTPTIVSGPYLSKDDARKAIESGDCKKAEKKADQKKTDEIPPTYEKR
jgi:uncharacterized protein YegP (UPF0339 family)